MHSGEMNLDVPEPSELLNGLGVSELSLRTELDAARRQDELLDKVREDTNKVEDGEELDKVDRWRDWDS